MKTCPTCGFGLFNYNHDTVTCKHGHVWQVGADLHGAATLAPVAPAEAYVPAEKRTVPVWAWVLAGVAGDSVLHLILGGLG